jgi:dipeptidyl aminopeptidase/acylaminoacyl peptidase
MPNVAELLDRESTTVDLEPGDFERLLRRRDRKERNRRIRAGALAIVLVLVTAAALARSFNAEDRTADDPAPAPVSRRNGEVLRVSNELQAQDPATGEVRTLADRYGGSRLFGNSVDSAAWSADGRWAAFEIRGCDGDSAVPTSGLWVTNGVGEPRHVKSRPCLDDDDRYVGHEHWGWSPSGALLAVADRTVGGDRLIIIDPATGDRTDFGEAAGDVTTLAWSPDGTRIAYGAVPTGTRDEYAAAADGSVHSVTVDIGEQVLLASSVGLVSGGETGAGIVWSPDASRIAVTTETRAGENRLYLMNADGSELELLTEDVVIAHTLGSPNAAWSPDGTRLAYATSDGDHMEVWNAPLDGSAAVVASSAPDSPYVLAGAPVWSPDGTRIAFRYSPATEERLYLVANADGTGQAREIDELRYRSWSGGSYFCECYG